MPLTWTSQGTLTAPPPPHHHNQGEVTRWWPVANGTHFNGNWADPATSLVAGPCRQSRKLLRVIAGGATRLRVEWANIYTITIPEAVGASCEKAGPNPVTLRMAVEYPAGQPRQVGGSTEWDSATAYDTGDQITYQGGSWVATAPSSGSTPAAGSPVWRPVRRYTVRWDRDTDDAGTVTFQPGDYAASRSLPLAETMQTGDMVAVLGVFAGDYIPYAATNGACNIAPFVDWIIDSPALPAAGAGITTDGVTTEANGSTTPVGSTDHLDWSLIPYATALTGDVPAEHCVAVAGDSIAQGYGGDVRDGEPCGIFPRLLDGAVWWRLAQGGNRAFCYHPGNAPWQMSVLRRCTSTTVNLALNDMFSGHDTPTLKADLERAWRMHADNTAGPLYAGLLTPISDSTDGWATTANQVRKAVAGTDEFPGDAATYPTSVYGEIAMWISQEGAPLQLADGSTVRAGQAGHPVTAFLDWRSFMSDAATSWKWIPGCTTDGAHPNPLAVINQVSLAQEQFADVILGGARPSPTQPAWDVTGRLTNYSNLPRILSNSKANPMSGTLMTVVAVSPGAMFSQVRAWAAQGANGSAVTVTVLTGADPAWLKVLDSATVYPAAQTLITVGFTGAPVWIPRGQVVAVCLTPVLDQHYAGRWANHESMNITGTGYRIAGQHTATGALSGNVNLLSDFAASQFTPWVELV